MNIRRLLALLLAAAIFVTAMPVAAQSTVVRDGMPCKLNLSVELPHDDARGDLPPVMINACSKKTATLRVVYKGIVDGTVISVGYKLNAGTSYTFLEHPATVDFNGQIFLFEKTVLKNSVGKKKTVTRIDVFGQ